MKLFPYIGLFASLLVGGCGSEKEDISPLSANSTTGTQATNSFAQDLIDESGCDPRIANAMAPFESDYGECSMPQFTEVCGEENVEAGILLIADARVQPGLNPWVWACARRMEPQIALVSACQYRFRQSPAVCECSVNASYSAEDDKDLLEWLAFTEANDPKGKEGKFKRWSTFGPNSRWEELSEIRARHYSRLESCMK